MEKIITELIEKRTKQLKRLRAGKCNVSLKVVRGRIWGLTQEIRDLKSLNEAIVRKPNTDNYVCHKRGCHPFDV